MSAPWAYRVVWPVEDPDATYLEARGFAKGELVQMAEEAGLVLLGEPVFDMVEHDPAEWPHTDLVLTATVDALPVVMSREQFATAVEWYAAAGRTDAEIGEVLGRPRNAVAYCRRVNRIPPGVPRGYRSRDEIAEPKWDAA